MDGLHMRRLFVLDSKDYDDTHSVTVKNTVRAIICRNGRYAMQQNRDGIYKIPGGGVENNESLLDTLCRETLEETGLVVIRDSVREIGDVLELRRDLFEEDNKYECRTFFYFCDVEEGQQHTHMTLSEIEKGFHPVFAKLDDIIESNRRLGKDVTCERDTRFLEMLRDGRI